MKQFIIGIFLVAGIVSCGEKTSTEVNADIVSNPNTASGDSTGKVASITFEESTFDFGEAIEGQVVEHVFKFTNTGSNDLIIFDAKGSCGCTVPEYPKTPIKPGATSEIRVKFDTNGKQNAQEKNVTITANTQPNISTLVIKGFVKPAK
jgi:hypothetical protein